MKKKKITYQIHFNDKLSKVEFQGKATYPLYILIRFKRKQTTVKSVFFDLYTKKPYNELGITIDQVTKLETELLDWILAKYGEGFSLERFTDLYKQSGKDLRYRMEDPFFDFLINFFMDRGIARYPGIINAVRGQMSGADIMDALTDTLKPELAQELTQAAAIYTPPYLPVNDFIAQKWPKEPPCFPVFRWKNQAIRLSFITHLKKHYPEYDPDETINRLDHIADLTT
ncbi:hypothetical protein MKQ70_32725 [Chitinophaga sedimenti]|uniref:hypothetical protein n=1 Tax=Chitinophaga sedimenti TaxID=2033606 RepID=UPI002003D71D|nr:hypothetical protein [Chitinophaga sedimenti]MCK7559481.1 hypothetical protein [Chitinophaga sedimenti]